MQAVDSCATQAGRDQVAHVEGPVTRKGAKDSAGLLHKLFMARDTPKFVLCSLDAITESSPWQPLRMKAGPDGPKAR